MHPEEELPGALRGAVDRCLGKESRVGVAFSGGLDSSLIAHLASSSDLRSKVTAYVFAVGDDVPDLESARDSAKTLGLDLVELLVGEDEVREEATKMGECIGSDDPFVLSFELPLWFVAREAEEKVILLGQGADELFGGYARHQRMSETELGDALARDAAGLPSVAKREAGISGRWGKEFRYPYLDPEIVRLAGRIPVRSKVDQKSRKIALREAALQLGVPGSVAGKEKKAAQYGSGTWRVLRPNGSGGTAVKR